MRLYRLLFCLSIFWISCEKNCSEDIHLGEIPLVNSSLNKIPYKKDQTLQFVNQNQDTFVYKVYEWNEEACQIDLGIHCSSKSTNSYLTASSFCINGSISLMNSWEVGNYIGAVTHFDLQFSLHNLNRWEDVLDTLLVDRLRICSSKKRELASNEKLAHNRLTINFNTRNLDDEVITKFSNTTFMNKIMLNNDYFFEVYQQGETPAKIFYNIEKGIIGFEDGTGQLWVLI